MPPHVFHTNKMLFDLKEQHRIKIEELQDKIKKLEEEIKIIQKFNERLDDL